MPNAETLAVLDDLEKAGFDTSKMREQAQRNPLDDNKLNSIVGGGILRRKEYTTYLQQKEEEVQTLRQKVAELAANQDNLKNLEGNDELYQQALEVIEVQRANLIDAGFSEEEVKNLSFKAENGLRSAVKKAKTIEDNPVEKKEEPVMANQEDFVKVDDFEKVAGNIVLGNALSSVKIQRQFDRARQLGIEITDEMVANFEKSIQPGLESGKTFDALGDAAFGIPAALQAKQEKENQEKIDSEVRRQVAEKLKDAGVPERAISVNRTARGLAPAIAQRVAAGAELKIEGEGGTRIINGRALPVNKHGDVEFYKLRGSSADRMQSAQKEMRRLEETRPEIFEDDY